MPRSVQASGLREFPILAGGEEANTTIRLKPHIKGSTPLNLAISYDDISGMQHVVEKLINIDVIDRKKERISKQVTLLPYFPKELLSMYSPSKQVGKGGFARVFRALKQMIESLSPLRCRLT